MRGGEDLVIFCRLRGGGIVCRIPEAVVVILQQLQLIVPVQTVDHQFFEDVVDDSKQGHADDHAHKAPQTAEEQDGKQHPEAGKTGGIAQDLGSDDVAVQLLQHQNKQDEPQCLDGVLDEDEQCGGDGTDEGTKEGDHVGDADDHRHQQRTGEPEDQAADVAQHADDGGVHDLAVDEAAEHPVCIESFFGDELCPVGLEDAVEHQLCLLYKPLAAAQHIHRYDDADDQILGDHHHVQYSHGGTADDVLHGGQQGVLDPGVQIGMEGVVRRVQQTHDLLVVFNELHMACPVYKLGNICLCRVVQGGDAGDQLRHDHHDQGIDDQQPEQDGKGHRQDIDKPTHLFRDEPPQKTFDGVTHRLQQVGDDCAVDEGHQDTGKGGDGIPKAVKPVDQEEKDDAQGDGTETGKHPVDIGFYVGLFFHHDRLHFCCGQQKCPQQQLDFIASAPDMQLVCLPDQLLPEVRVCHADQSLCLLPAGETLQVHAAVLGAQVVDIGAGVGDDAAVFQSGTDAALHLAGLLIKEGGGQADKALAALGQVGAQNKVQLTTCAGDVLDAGTFGVHLTEQVNVHRIVDGDEVVQSRDAADIVGVVHGSRHALGVVVEVVVHLLGACTEGVDLTTLIQLLAAAVDLASLGNVHKGIHIHLGMDAQILQVALGDKTADGVGHTADAQLQAGTVGDLRHDEVGDLQIHFGGSAGSSHLPDGRIAALHDAGDLRDVHAVLHAAQAPGHVGVDFHDDLFCLLAHGTQMGGAGTKVEVTVGVHGGHLKNGDVHRICAFPVVAGQLGVADGGVEGKALSDRLALNAAHMPAVPGHVGSGVLNLEDLRHPHQDAAPEVDPFQLRQPLCQLGIHRHRGVYRPAVVHPVTALDQSSSFGSRHAFLRIQIHKIHYKPSSLKIHKRIVNFAPSEERRITILYGQKTSPVFYRLFAVLTQLYHICRIP